MIVKLIPLTCNIIIIHQGDLKGEKETPFRTKLKFLSFDQIKILSIKKESPETRLFTFFLRVAHAKNDLKQMKRVFGPYPYYFSLLQLKHF